MNGPKVTVAEDHVVHISSVLAAPRIGNDTVRIWPYAGRPVYPTLLTIPSGLTSIVVTT